MLKKLFFMYIVYVVYFLGVGLTSSGIVLMPFNAIRYSLILATGLLLFSTGSFINEFVIEKKSASWTRILKLVMVSLALAIGVGMISGGISHYKESPTYASYLIPLGVIVSFVSFAAKNGYALSRKEVKIAAATLTVTGLLLFAGLHIGSKSYVDSGSGHAAHGGDVFAHANCPM